MPDEICVDLLLTNPDVDWIEQLIRFHSLKLSVKMLEMPGDIRVCGDSGSLNKLKVFIQSDLEMKNHAVVKINKAIEMEETYEKARRGLSDLFKED